MCDGVQWQGVASGWAGKAGVALLTVMERNATRGTNLFSNVGDGFHYVAEIIMQLVSGRGRDDAAFRTSTSSFLDPEAQSGVEWVFLTVAGFHTVEKDQLESS